MDGLRKDPGGYKLLVLAASPTHSVAELPLRSCIKIFAIPRKLPDESIFCVKLLLMNSCNSCVSTGVLHSFKTYFIQSTLSFGQRAKNDVFVFLRELLLDL